MIRDKLTKLIEKSQAHIKDDVRDYIGASGIGHDCLRKIWYEFKGEECEDVPTKMRRTWAIGKHLEGLIVQWLEKSGIEIATSWFDLRSDNVPFFRGHLDCVWTKNDEPHAIIEIKTAKDASFKLFVKNGLRAWNPQYYAQLQSYMGMSKIFSAYILVLNKDNSALSDEFVPFDEDFYKGIEDKALMIANAVIAPPRINGSPLWFQCKLCRFNRVCHS